MSLNSSQKPGFSLVETVITAGIFSMLTIILLGIFITHLRLIRINSALSEMQSQRTLLLSYLQKNIHQASSVQDQIEISGAVYTSDEDQLVLALPSIDENGIVIPESEDSIVFFLDGTLLKMHRQPDMASSRPAVSDKIIARDIGYLLFDYASVVPQQAGGLNVEVIFERFVLGKDRTVPLSLRLYLKNL